MDQNFSQRSDDGRARYSTEALVAELERRKKEKGGNYMNITGMNLGIVKTLLNHLNKLQDRIEVLEGQVGGCSPHRELRDRIEVLEGQVGELSSRS